MRAEQLLISPVNFNLDGSVCSCVSGAINNKGCEFLTKEIYSSLNQKIAG